MFFYITEEANEKKFDFLQENFILNKEIKKNMNYDSFMKFLKKEVRNLKVKSLILDLNCFQIDDFMDLKDAFDSFYLLYPESQIILLPEEDGKSDSLYELQADYINKLFILAEPDNPEIEFFNIIDKIKSGEAANDVIDELVEVDPIENSIVIEAKDESFKTEVKPPKVPIIAVDEIIKKPIQVNQGKPLKAPINQKKEIEKHNEPEEERKPEIKTLQDYITEKQIKSKWKCQNFMIGIMGVERKVGSTTAAIQIANYLQSIGAKVSYVEANTHNHLDLIAEDNEFLNIKDHYLKKSISYFPEYKYDSNAGSNFIIFDLGCFNEYVDKIDQFVDNMDKVILVSGRQPYEHASLDTAINIIADNAKINILFNLAMEKEISKMKKKYQNEARLITNIKYCPDLILPSGFTGNKDIDEFFREIE
jgi:hypothetical protein